MLHRSLNRAVYTCNSDDSIHLKPENGEFVFWHKHADLRDVMSECCVGSAFSRMRNPGMGP